MKKRILVVLFALFAAQGASAQHLYDNFLGPLIDSCPGFDAGTSDVEVDVPYDNNNTGLHRYVGSCVSSVSGKTLKEGPRILGNPIGIKLNEGSKGPREPDCNCPQEGNSVIYPGSGIVGETIPLDGVPFDLGYSTNWIQGQKGVYTIHLPLYDVNSLVTGYKLHAEYAGGRVIDESFSNVQDQEYVFHWDGKDVSGNLVTGSIPFNFRLTVLTHGREIPIDFINTVGALKADVFGFGGWMPSVLYYYDKAREFVAKGDGTFKKLSSKTLPNGNLIVAEDDLSAVYIFDPQGKHLYTKTPMTGSNKYTFNYDINGDLISISEPYGQTTTFTRTNGLVTSITGPKGQVTQLSYNNDDRLALVTKASGARYQIEYDQNGLMKSFKKPEGQMSHFFYDEEGRLTLDYHSSGTFKNLSSEVESSHVENFTLTTPMGRALNFHMQNTLSRHDETHIWYENQAGGEIYHRSGGKSETIAKGDTVFSQSFRQDQRFFRDAQYPGYSVFKIKDKGLPTYQNQTVDLDDPEDPFSLNTYKMEYKTIGKTRTDFYDADQRKWTYTSFGGRVRTVETNFYEQPTKTQVGNELPTLFTYQTDGRLSQVSQGKRKTRFSYDENGYLESITNALLQTTHFVNDLSGRVIKTILPGGEEIKTEYDENGNLISITPPEKPKHSFFLNAYELLKTYLPPALGGNPVKTEYKYNLDKQLTQVIRPDGKEINYIYDVVSGWNTAIQVPEGTYSIDYDIYKKVTETSSPDGITDHYQYYGPFISQDEQNISGILPVSLNWHYDGEHREKVLNLTDVNDVNNAVSKSYDKDDLVIRSGLMSYERNNSRGFITKMSLGRLSINHTYSTDFNELERIEYLNNKRTEYLVEYKRDLLGRISREIKNGFDDLLMYDSSGRFIGRKGYGSKEVKSDFRYDENGNRIYSKVGDTKVEATYDDQDRLLTWGDNEYTYNENGDLETKHNTSTDELTEYEYDVFGNLKSVTLPNEDVITYKVDGKNRRVIKSKNGTQVYRFIYQDDLKIAAQIDSSGNLVKRFVYGDSLNMPDYMEYDGKRYLFVKDVRGSVLKVVDSETGTVAQELTYDDWGKVLSDSNPGFQPFGFAGGIYDYETGLVRFGARDYDAETGRWTSKDPILFNGGDTNLYGYVLNDPVNWADVNGKWPNGACVLFATVAGAAYGTIIGGIEGGMIGVAAGGIAGMSFCPDDSKGDELCDPSIQCCIGYNRASDSSL